MRWTIALCALFILTACNSSSTDEDETVVNPPEPPVLDNPPWPEGADVTVDFRAQDHGVEIDIANYYESNEDSLETDFTTVIVPSSEDYEGYAQRFYWVTGSGATYFTPYFLVKVDGLTPGALYDLTFTVEVLTMDGHGSYDGGGGPSISGGMFKEPPVKQTDQDGRVILWLGDRELEASVDTVSLGNIELPDGLAGDWRIKRVTNDVESYSGEANMDGEAWLFIRVATGHLGYNDFYMTRAAFELDEY